MQDGLVVCFVWEQGCGAGRKRMIKIYMGIYM